MNRVIGVMGNVKMRMERVSQTARNMLLLTGGGIGAVLKVASDLEETTSKFDAVFKSQADAARDFVDEQARVLNRSNVDLLRYMATLQDTFVPFGFARDRALEMSKAVTKLGIDLASFNNLADDDVIHNLTSALVGNHEAVRRFGVVITQATLNQQLFNMGIRGGAKEATEQEKVLARMQLVLDSTKDAQGDAERTSQSFANQLKGLRADIINLSAALGNALIPTVKNYIASIRQGVPSLTEWIKQNQENIVWYAKLGVAILALLFVLPRLVTAFEAVIVTMKAMAIAGRSAQAALALMAGSPILIALAALAATIGVVVKQLKDEQAAFDEVVEKSRRFAESWKELKQAQEEFRAAETIEDQITALTRVIKLQEKLMEQDEQVGSSKAFQRQLDNNRQTLERLNEQLAANAERAAQVTKEEVDLQKSIEDITDKLKEQIATFGQSADAVDLYRLKLAGATEEQIKGVRQLQDSLRALNERREAEMKAAREVEQRQKQLQAEAESLRSAYRTPQERLTDELNKIRELRAGGFLTAAEAARLSGRARRAAAPSRAASAGVESLDATFRRIQTSVLDPQKRLAQLMQSTASNTQSMASATKTSAERLGEILDTLRDAVNSRVGALFN